MGDYRKLRAWQLARDLVVISHPLIERLPTPERYALADQWRRAAYGYLAREDMTQVLPTRAECARTVYGLLRRMSGPS